MPSPQWRFRGFDAEHLLLLSLLTCKCGSQKSCSFFFFFACISDKDFPPSVISLALRPRELCVCVCGVVANQCHLHVTPSPPFLTQCLLQVRIYCISKGSLSRGYSPTVSLQVLRLYIYTYI